ncbi:hypothetical protein DD592_27140, partial [Enterobacter cloacae complex sp. 2DZ2F20B]
KMVTALQAAQFQSIYNFSNSLSVIVKYVTNCKQHIWGFLRIQLEEQSHKNSSILFGERMNRRQ